MFGNLKIYRNCNTCTSYLIREISIPIDSYVKFNSLHLFYHVYLYLLSEAFWWLFENWTMRRWNLEDTDRMACFRLAYKRVSLGERRLGHTVATPLIPTANHNTPGCNLLLIRKIYMYPFERLRSVRGETLQLSCNVVTKTQWCLKQWHHCVNNNKQIHFCQYLDLCSKKIK